MYTDILTKKEAESLGIIGNDGLGFVKPQTAFKNITEQILAEIKKGNLVWRKGWRSGIVVKGKTYGAQNYETQRPYTGGNAFFINMQNLLNGTAYRFFLTHKQIKERGASLKQGAKPFPVSVFIKNITTKEVIVKGEKKEVNAEEAGVIWYYVYPIDLVDGLKEIKRKTHKPDTFNEIVVTDAETIINNMPKAPPIKHGGNEAYWTPDRVQMPLKKAFKIPQQYYSTLFHELTHSTGYKTRLDRDVSGKFGSKPYALEELIAEISAAYLCGVCEIDYYTVNNSAAYLKSWANRLLTEIASDPNFLKRAVFKAARAATFIIGKTLEKHGIVVKLGGKKKVIKPEEKPHKGKEITPNKTVKASVNKAIEDLMNTNKELKKIGAMALGMLFSSYKNDNFPDTNEGLKGKLFEKMEQQGIVEYMTRYELTEYGLEIVKKIEARLETLKAKKSGTDLFPELAGVKKPFSQLMNTIILIKEANEKYKRNEVYYRVNQFLDLLQNRKFDNSIFSTTTKLKEALIKVGYNDSILDFNAFSQIDTIVLHLNEKQQNIVSGVTDAVLIFINAFLSTHNKTVTKEDLAYMLATFQTAIKSGVIKAKHPLATIANQTQDKLVNVINKLRPNEKIKIQISNKQEIENKVVGLHGLGFWNVVASAVIGKSAEYLAMKAFKKKEVATTEPKSLNGIEGFTRADKTPQVKAAETFRLNGELGKLLGDIQAYKYSIVLTGDPHAGKTEFTMQLANGFSEIGKTVGAFMLEQGGLESKDTKAAIERNIIEKNKKNVYVTGEAQKGIQTIKDFATKFDVVIIDSWQKLGIPSTKFDTLRHEFPNTIFIVIFQQNGEGGTRGGVSADYDTPVHLKVHKVDATFVNNYVEVKKNRGNSDTLALHYKVKSKKIVKAD